MTELQLSYVRSIAKIVGATLAAKGVIDSTDVVTLISILESLVGAGIAAYGLWHSHRTHA